MKSISPSYRFRHGLMGSSSLLALTLFLSLAAGKSHYTKASAPNRPVSLPRRVSRSAAGDQLPAAPRAGRPAAPPLPSMENLGRLPLRFERNDGQAGPGVKFLSHGRGYTLFLTRDEAVLEFKKSEVRSQESEGNRLLSLVPGPRTAGERVLNTKDQGQMTKDAILSMKIAGANRSAPVAAADELSGKSNYYLGKDPKKWQTGVPNYARVQYQGIYPGIDLAYYGNQGGQLTTRSRSSSIPFWFTPPNHTAGFSLSPSGSEKIFIMRSFSQQPRVEVRAVQRMINHPADIHSPHSAHNRILSFFPRK